MKKIFKIITILNLLLLLGTLSSCVSSDNSINNSFVKKYGKKVKEINSDRVLKTNENLVVSTPPSKEEIQDYIASQEKYQGYVPIYNVGEYVPKQMSPNSLTSNDLAANNPANAVPFDIFEVKYNTNLHPPFKYTGIEFDMVAVPTQDAFGNLSQVNEKKYQMIANKDLQNSIERINQDRDNDHIEYSKILIIEKKQQIRKRKNEQIFGSEDFTKIALVDNTNEEQSSNKIPEVSNNNQNTMQTN